MNGSDTNFLNDVSCTSASNCIAVGADYNAASFHPGKVLAQRWNGSAWVLVPTPGVGEAYDNGVSCTSPTNCVAVGARFRSGIENTLVERWDGKTWAVVASPNPKDLQAGLVDVSCTSPTNCMAVGSASSFPNPFVGVVQTTLMEQWNGKHWTILASPNAGGVDTNDLSGVSCTSPTNCIAVGTAYNNVGPFRTLVERWNGKTWAIVASPKVAGFSLSRVSCTSPTSCVAVGFDDNSPDPGVFATVALAMNWNGKTWATTQNATSGGLSGVSCTSATNCVAVGDLEGNFPNQTLAEQWNGKTWTIVASPNVTGATANALGAVSCRTAAACMAVGEYAPTPKTGRTLTEDYA